MRFNLTLVPKSKKEVAPINYQYPLSAVIYKILARADKDYASFLHEQGYTKGDTLKNFKLFTFSDLKVDFKLVGDRMYVNSDAEVVVSFHLPQAAAHFVKGLFLSQDMDIADKKSKASFHVASVKALPNAFQAYKAEEVLTMNFNTTSACVAGIKQANGHYDFISPQDARFPLAITYNWEAKLKALGIFKEKSRVKVTVLPCKTGPRSRLMTIKAFTPAQTKIKGYVGFGLQLTAQKEYLEVLYNSGVGVYNALGMGCANIID